MSNNGTADPSAEVPQLRPGVDLRRLAIGPEDAFVFSRIDGHASIREIQLTTGLPRDRVLTSLQTLARHGAIEPLEHAERAAENSGVARLPDEPRPATGPEQPNDAQFQVVPLPPGDAPLSERVEAMLARSEVLDHYQLLGLPRSADKKAIKGAYFSIVSNYHPDKYYGEELGETKARLELVFQRLTQAEETLTRSKKRKAYDATLGPEQPLEATRSTASQLDPTPTSRAAGGANATTSATPSKRVNGATPPSLGTDNGSASQRLQTASGNHRKTNGTHAPPPSSQARSKTEGRRHPVASRPGSMAPATKRSPGATPPLPTDSQQQDNPLRKQRARTSVARRFASMAGARSQKSLVPPSLVETSVRLPTPPGVSSQSMARALTSTSTPSLSQGRLPAAASPALSSQIKRYVATAETELTADNPLAAANAYRLALSLSPDDMKLQQSLAEAELAADRRMAEENLLQAKVRERNGDFQAAGRLYTKAARGRQSGELYAQAARCFRKDDNGLKLAGEQARKALELEPGNPANHLLLAEIYIEARMPQSAIKLLESALRLQPNDDAMKQLLSRLQRGD